MSGTFKQHDGDAATVDIGRVLDDGPFTSMQIITVLLSALCMVLDGFDGQLIGFAIPAIIKEWGISRTAFAPVVAAGLIGMGVGSAGAGLVADRIGRRATVIGSVFLFGLATCAIGFAPDLPTIAALRLLAGLGIGGALPSATTLTAEFTPLRHRTVAVTSTIVCFPLGGMLAGFFANTVLPAEGWRHMFVVGGAIPVILGIVLLYRLYESPRFLSRREAQWSKLRELLARMSRRLPADCRFVDAAEQAAEVHAGFTALFRDGHARNTLAIWGAFFMSMLAVYTAFSWLPTMLTAEGLSTSLAGSGLTAYNLGGVVGALSCAFAITRFGSRWPQMLSCAGAAISAFALRGLPIADNTSLLIVGLGIHGLFVNAVQATLYAVCTQAYPTKVRATGTASALAFGRLGAILSAFAGAMVITAGGATAYLSLLGGAMAIAMVALGILRGHIIAPVRGAPAQPVSPGD